MVACRWRSCLMSHGWSYSNHDLVQVSRDWDKPSGQQIALTDPPANHTPQSFVSMHFHSTVIWLRRKLYLQAAHIKYSTKTFSYQFHAITAVKLITDPTRKSSVTRKLCCLSVLFLKKFSNKILTRCYSCLVLLLTIELSEIQVSETKEVFRVYTHAY